MLVAMSSSGSKVVAASSATESRCPSCGNTLVVRLPVKRVPHFAHHPGDGAPYRAAQTPAARRARLRAAARAARRAQVADSGQEALFDFAEGDV